MKNRWQIILISLCLIYFIFRWLLPQFTPAARLSFNYAVKPCNSVSAAVQYSVPGRGLITTDLLPPYIIPPGTLGIHVFVCPKEPTIFSALAIESASNNIDFLKETNKLQCYGCINRLTKDGKMEVAPLTANPVLVLAGNQSNCRYCQFFPPLFVGLCLIWLFFHLTPSMFLRGLFVSGLGLVYVISRSWPKLRSLFPPPAIGSQQIIGNSHMVGLSLSADYQLFILLVLLLYCLICIGIGITRKKRRV